ncbi:MAG: transcription-repair coupling factor [Gemmatimonadetes bacterium]|nr:transcription-repair coupling factor [Gemmatimonadota bacterium]
MSEPHTIRPNAILDAIESCRAVRTLLAALPSPGSSTTISGAHGSAATALVAVLHRRTTRVIVVVAPDPAAAAAAEADLEVLLGEGASALYPQREALPYESTEPHLEIGGLRVEAVEAMFSGRARLFVTTLRALQERAPVPDRLARLRITLTVGQKIPFAELVAALEERGFERVALLEEVGQFAVRGGLLDLFSFGSPEPIRVEFWDDEISSIRSFDILDQRSTGPLAEAHVLPVDFRGGQGESTTVSRSLLDLLPREAILIQLGSDDWDTALARTWEQVRRFHADLLAQGRAAPEPGELFLEPAAARRMLSSFPLLAPTAGGGGDLALGAEPTPVIERDIDRLDAFLREGAARSARTLLLCDNEGQAQRLEEILGGKRAVLPIGAQVMVGSLEAGFVLDSAEPPLRVLNDHEIFRRTRRVRRGRRFRGAVALESLAQLTPGDFVVHLDHGVGQFLGLQRVTVAGEEIESLAIEYAGGEVLRVPVYRLDLIERWVGATDDAEPPQVHRIGGRQWKTLRRKTEAAIEQMTAELLHLYARRESAPGFSYSPDGRWQKEMESSFLYEDTPDQRKATEDVKRDMESTRPMDRLICGDVGYGKTEIAVRAAFKAVQDGKQVAVLAPTTILVEQHRHTFEQRLADYPVKVAALSRFRSAKEVRAILDRLEAGDVDIIIGTHRLLSSDVQFKDLGLVIVDEEQRFGVKHKERLKELRASVDVLTMTATPIPRTLYLSLSRIRDLTLIRTPPRDRMPILTHVTPWIDHVLEEAMARELDRGGQIFFLHNRVETIEMAADRVARLAPGASIEVAHGQMTPRDLDDVMTAFVDGTVDILVCSAIIENGLDVPNANTLIVDHAERFGLSQLYQIRGRVGRSDKRAYCYLVVPANLSEDAERRLKVLEHYTELGSGYSVALKDLELRGAGNMLGADQSGFAHAVGLDVYLRLLERTVEKFKEKEGEVEYPDPEVALGGSAYLPEGYISDPGQKLHLYRRLSRIGQHAEVEGLRQELADRFGPPPPEVERLLDQVTLRLLGRSLGIERIMVRARAARITFRPGVVPRLAILERPLRDRQVEVEVRRMAPLSLELRQVGPVPLTGTLVKALAALLDSLATA